MMMVCVFYRTNWKLPRKRQSVASLLQVPQATGHFCVAFSWSAKHSIQRSCRWFLQIAQCVTTPSAQKKRGEQNVSQVVFQINLPQRQSATAFHRSTLNRSSGNSIVSLTEALVCRAFQDCGSLREPSFSLLGLRRLVQVCFGTVSLRLSGYL